MVHPEIIKRQRDSVAPERDQRPRLHITAPEPVARPVERETDSNATRRGCEIVDFAIAEASIV